MLDVIALIVVVAVPAIVLHEVAHGFVANVLGDPTAKNMGRLTLNPLPHVDPVGSVLIPGALFLLHYLHLTSSLILFGWAKPVPVNFRSLRPQRLGMILVAAAGPLVNMILAWIWVQVFNSHQFDQWSNIVAWGILLNLTLAVFNLVPIPPLDGSRIVSALLPARLSVPYNRLERYGLIILLILINVGFFSILSPIIARLAALLGVDL